MEKFVIKVTKKGVCRCKIQGGNVKWYGYGNTGVEAFKEALINLEGDMDAEAITLKEKILPDVANLIEKILEK